ncbi:uncharacterized protein SOCE26_069950 [Sorangium cellulosum]|uniref:Uncharacterized protein n=1 Tax=Sorangium cellulosum TaxID=56 RepID=A0A2L0F1U1_SORCE|nr:uncharacterized protein SOCE26_069950 [Sorangium cellulosum]
MINDTDYTKTSRTGGVVLRGIAVAQPPGGDIGAERARGGIGSRLWACAGHASFGEDEVVRIRRAASGAVTLRTWVGTPLPEGAAERVWAR